MQYPDETAEAKRVVDEISNLMRWNIIEPRNVANLFRTNEQPQFKTELRRAKVPYTLIGGMSFRSQGSTATCSPTWKRSLTRTTRYRC